MFAAPPVIVLKKILKQTAVHASSPQTPTRIDRGILMMNELKATQRLLQFSPGLSLMLLMPSE